MGESKALAALFPGPRRSILSALFGEPEREWNLAELAGRAGVQPASANRHIRQLRNGGLVSEQRNGGPTTFRANTSCPVFAELQSILVKLGDTARAGETILIVEDQEATAQITRILLESWGYHVLEAHNGGEALEIFERENGEIQLLLTDVTMPGISGPQLAHQMLCRRPELRVVFMSGYPNDELTNRKCAFLPKPFNPASLSKMIRTELDRSKASPAGKINAE
jgi:CheY-like chemotaxis protein